VTLSPRYYRECGPHYRGIPGVPITVQTSTPYYAVYSSCTLFNKIN